MKDREVYQVQYNLPRSTAWKPFNVPGNEQDVVESKEEALKLLEEAKKHHSTIQMFQKIKYRIVKKKIRAN